MILRSSFEVFSLFAVKFSLKWEFDFNRTGDWEWIEGAHRSLVESIIKVLPWPLDKLILLIGASVFEVLKLALPLGVETELPIPDLE